VRAAVVIFAMHQVTRPEGAGVEMLCKDILCPKVFGMNQTKN